MKLAQCVSQCKLLQSDITFMQETHIIGHDTIIFHTDLNGWQFVNSGMKLKSRAGVGLIISPNVKIVDINNIFERRILLARLILHGNNTLQKPMLKVKKEHPGFKLIVGADMNSTVGNDSNGSWSYLGTNNDSLSTNDNGWRLLSMTQKCNLYILNSFYDSKPIHRHTCYSPTGFSKRVDYILTDWHIKKLSTNCRVYRKASIPFESDHRLLVLHCSFPSKIRTEKFLPKTLD